MSRFRGVAAAGTLGRFLLHVEGPVSSYKTDQHHVRHRGRDFHFVSYEGHVANPRTGERATPATWFLMSAGKRWPAIVQVPDQEPAALIEQLTRWLDEHVFSPRRAS